jgi:poly-gamma-glutamate capsule biosynthesis protein CapA/YwtB (metallophosphatase superfamily)
MGDTMLARGIGDRITGGDNPYKFVQDYLHAASIRVANVETTIADPAIATTAATKTYTFNAPLASLDTLKANNIDVSLLGNNHTSDYGAAATANMLQQFQRRGLQTAGIGNTVEDAFRARLVNMPLKNDQDPDDMQEVTIGFIAVNDIDLTFTKVRSDRTGGAYFDQQLISESIQKARQDGAVAVFVVPHWGIEYQTTPSGRQKDWARKFIDSGADAVIGAHPHVVQPTEFYKEKPIIYSMGNFIFDGMSGEATKGQMIKMPITLTKTIANQTASSITISTPVSIPVQIDRFGYPTPIK